MSHVRQLQSLQASREHRGSYGLLKAAGAASSTAPGWRGWVTKTSTWIQIGHENHSSYCNHDPIADHTRSCLQATDYMSEHHNEHARKFNRKGKSFSFS